MQRLAALAVWVVMMYAGPAMAQSVIKPDGVPTITVPGNIPIAVIASANAGTGFKEFVGVFEQHTDGFWYWNGMGSTQLGTADMGAAIVAAGGAQQYLTNVALPIVNQQIRLTYYGQNTTPTGPTPPAAGSDPLAFLNYSLQTQFKFGTVNGVQSVVPN